MDTVNNRGHTPYDAVTIPGKFTNFIIDLHISSLRVFVFNWPIFNFYFRCS